MNRLFKGILKIVQAEMLLLIILLILGGIIFLVHQASQS